jgi:hypothetical protein
MTPLKSLALLAIGALAGYLVAGVRYEKKYVEYTEALEKEYAEQKELSEKKVDPDEDWRETTSKETEDEVTETDKPIVRNPLTAPAATALKNYQSMSRTPMMASTATLVSAELEAEDLDEGVRDNDDPTIPYIIEQSDFADLDSPYENLTVSWFTKDNIVTDLNNEKLPEAWVARHIGFENLRKFARMDEHYMYVRCESQEKDFEICKVEGFYDVEVLGHSAPGGDDAA